MGATFTKSGDSAVVTLSRDLTLPYAPDIRQVLIKALLDADSISISLEDVDEVDMSCLQMLCSTHRSAARLNKHLAFSATPPQVFCDMLAAAGFRRTTGCKLDTDKSCLWASCGG